MRRDKGGSMNLTWLALLGAVGGIVGLATIAFTIWSWVRPSESISRTASARGQIVQAARDANLRVGVTQTGRHTTITLSGDPEEVNRFVLGGAEREIRKSESGSTSDDSQQNPQSS